MPVPVAGTGTAAVGTIRYRLVPVILAPCLELTQNRIDKAMYLLKKMIYSRFPFMTAMPVGGFVREGGMRPGRNFVIKEKEDGR